MNETKLHVGSSPVTSVYVAPSSNSPGFAEHKHTNANELLHCISGQGEVIIHRDDGDDPKVFGEGQSVFLPKDIFHTIIPSGEIELLLFFTSNAPDRVNAA